MSFFLVNFVGILMAGIITLSSKIRSVFCGVVLEQEAVRVARVDGTRFVLPHLLLPRRS